MQIVVVGASGATGRLLVQQLLDAGHHVKAIVRDSGKLPDALRGHRLLSIVEAGILELDEAELTHSVRGCDAVASCLGHNLSFRGIFGQPRRLVAEATKRLCRAVAATAREHPVRFVLMNTAGNRNRDLREPVSFAHRCVVGVVRALLPPHADNEAAADFLRTEIGQDDPNIEWVVVRPDTLVNDERVTAFEVHPSPTRSAIFDPGKTSRHNVAAFMKALIEDAPTWSRWKGQMPVLYNAVQPQ